MSSKIFRTIKDFSRHRYDIEMTCYCGHKATLAVGPVGARFVSERWPVDLNLAVRYFRCSKCGGRPRQIGPMEPLLRGG